MLSGKGQGMADDSTRNLPKNGPTAPKDPVARRCGFYVLFDTVVEATAHNTGMPSQDIYLEGSRLLDRVKLIGGVDNDEILALLKDCQGFRQAIHSIGVTLQAHSNTGSVTFVLQNWGKTNKYESGTLLRVPCTTDGAENLIKLDDYDWNADDDVLGKIAFEFDQPGELATASVKFYLQDGFDVPETSPEPPVAFGSEPYEAMIAKSLLSKGNNKRLKAAIDKAERGEHVSIAYIGGSITQGAGAKPIHTGCYAYKSYLKFKELFGQGSGGHIQFVKAGVGGTPSELGMIRYDRDILRDGAVQPDIVIVEFAVNDEGDETKGVCFESLILKILSAPNKPAVILLFSVFVNDWNLQDRLSPVGTHYNLPMVSVKDAVVEQFRLTHAEGNVISKRQFFYDIYHPTNDGHTIMADCLSYLFSETKKSGADAEDIVIAKAPIIGNDFVYVQLLDRKTNTIIAKIDEGRFVETDADLQMVEIDDHPYGTPQFPYNWMRSAAAGGESFKMTVKSRSLLLVFKDSGSVEFGKADVYVDGRHVLTADPHINNWTHCNAIILYREDDSREHFVEIKMAPEDEGKKFTIVAFGFTL